MNAHRRSGSELDLLRGTPILVPPPTEVEAERARLVPWLEGEIAELPLRRGQERARARRRMAVISGAFAVAAGVGFALWNALGGSLASPGVSGKTEVEMAAATLLDGRLESGSLEVLPGSRLGEASRFRTKASGGARLLTSGGATLSAAAQTEFALLPESKAQPGGAVIQLSRGSIDFSVPKQEEGRAFHVKTKDALVTVVGTRFFVDASGPTCVRVEEGRVRVERGGEERLLDAGQSWGCEVASVPQATSEPARNEQLAGGTPARSRGEPSTSQATRTESQLDQQNRLLATALAAERRGEVRRAGAAFEELLRKYPDSPFGPEARAGLVRLKGR